MYRESLKPYQNKIIEVNGSIVSIRHQSFGGTSQICMTNVKLGENMLGHNIEPVDHVWFGIERPYVAAKIFQYIREQCRLYDESRSGRLAGEWKHTGKHYIANNHLISIRAKVSCYNNYTKFGLRECEENTIYLYDTHQYITWDDVKKEIVVSYIHEYCSELPY